MTSIPSVATIALAVPAPVFVLVVGLPVVAAVALLVRLVRIRRAFDQERLDARRARAELEAEHQAAVETTLRDLGVPRRHIHAERFAY